MAFTINTFTNTTLSGNGNPQFFLYATEDKQADLLAESYFNDAYNVLHHLDVIIATTDLVADAATRKITCFVVTKLEDRKVTVAKGAVLFEPAAPPPTSKK